jgi:hypothetical protein
MPHRGNGGRSLADWAKWLLFFALGGADAARADSDGIFCAGPGYVAYELRAWSTASRQHELRIVRVGGKARIAEPVTSELADFQVHGMRCEKDRVVLMGWDRKYSIALAPPMRVDVEATAAGEMPAGYEASAFSNPNGPKIVGIPSQIDDRAYAIQIVRREENRVAPGKGGVIAHRTRARIVELDAAMRVTNQYEVYRATHDETVD